MLAITHRVIDSLGFRVAHHAAAHHAAALTHREFT